MGTSPPHLFRGLRMVGLMTLLSRVLGMIRDMAMAGQFGLGPIMDAFTVAFRIPNLSRKLFGEGALATAFIPVFVRNLQTSDRDDAWRLASAVFTRLTLFLSIIVLLVEVPLWSWLLWGNPGTENRLLIILTATMLPYLILICLACQVSAVLNALGHFTWPAVAPVVLNVIWLFAAFCLCPWFESLETQAFIEALAIVIAGFFQVWVQWPTLRSFGFRLRWDWHPIRDQYREILRTMLPVIVGLSITQINTFSDSLIAWCFAQPRDNPDALLPFFGGIPYPMTSGAVSALYFGERMYQFPLGIFGVALGTVLFPLFSRHAVRGDLQQLRDDLELGMRLVVAIGVAASIGLILLAEPIARALFQRGEFGPADSLRTAVVIAAYGSGVWAYCAIQILQRAFYAVLDRRTPLRIGLWTVGLNFLLNLTLIWPFAEVGLAASTAVCAMLQTGVLTWALQQRTGRWPWRGLIVTTLKTLICCATMSLAVYASSDLLAASGKWIRLLVPLTLASATFLLTAWLVRLKEIWLLLKREAPGDSSEVH